MPFVTNCPLYNEVPFVANCPLYNEAPFVANCPLYIYIGIWIVYIGGWGGGGCIPFCIKLHFVFLMLQIKVIDCKNTNLLEAL